LILFECSLLPESALYFFVQEGFEKGQMQDYRVVIVNAS
jgi:hypothetical protein